MIVPVREPLILFDGVCNLCNAWVTFLARRDPTGIFRFAPQQSPVGQAIIEERLSGASQLSSVILIEDDATYTESDAVLQTLARLSPPWSWMALFDSSLADLVTPATGSWFVIGTNGSAELKCARYRQRT